MSLFRSHGSLEEKGEQIEKVCKWEVLIASVSWLSYVISYQSSGPSGLVLLRFGSVRFGSVRCDTKKIC